MHTPPGPMLAGVMDVAIVLRLPPAPPAPPPPPAREELLLKPPEGSALGNPPGSRPGKYPPAALAPTLPLCMLRCQTETMLWSARDVTWDLPSHNCSREGERPRMSHTKSGDGLLCTWQLAPAYLLEHYRLALGAIVTGGTAQGSLSRLGGGRRRGGRVAAGPGVAGVRSAAATAKVLRLRGVHLEERFQLRLGRLGVAMARAALAGITPLVLRRYKHLRVTKG